MVNSTEGGSQVRSQVAAGAKYGEFLSEEKSVEQNAINPRKTLIRYYYLLLLFLARSCNVWWKANANSCHNFSRNSTVWRVFDSSGATGRVHFSPRGVGLGSLVSGVMGCGVVSMRVSINALAVCPANW